METRSQSRARACRMLASLPLLVAAATGAQASPAAIAAAEDAMKRNDHAEIVGVLLPVYRRGELTDARGLYVLSRGCYFHAPTPVQILRRQLCRDQSGRITLRAAEAGSVSAMLDLAYSMHRPDPMVAHPNLRPDSGQAYRWALLARDLSVDAERKARAEEKVDTLFADIVEATGNPVPNPVIERGQGLARRDFLRLAPTVNPALLPGPDGFTDLGQFRGLGWLEVPGTGAHHENKEGDDSIYALSIRREGDSVHFDASINDLDLYRLVQIRGDCASKSAVVVRDSGWLGYGEAGDDPQASQPPYPAVAAKRWSDPSADMEAIVAFACSAEPMVGARAVAERRA